MTKYVSCVDTAKLVRKALKEAFPDIKFRVKCSSYSGGASINVYWFAGPNAYQVQAITNGFCGSYFDGSIDYKGSRFALLDGEAVSFGADFIHTNRRYTRVMCENVLRRLTKRYGAPAMDGVTIRGDDEYGYRLHGVDINHEQTVASALYRHSDRLKILPSKTAEQLIDLGNDGYSEVGRLA